jgi:hypothetical protein
MVVAAYSEERYDLGEALARLCGQASRMEKYPKLAAVPVDPAVYEVAPAPRHEPQHVQELAQRHEPEAPLPTDGCSDCGGTIRWSMVLQEWTHIDDRGRSITPTWAHKGRPAEAVNESNAPAPEEAGTLVVPSGRCVAHVARNGGECHGVIYWAAPTAGLPAMWLHFDPAITDHAVVPNRPDPTKDWETKR